MPCWCKTAFTNVIRMSIHMGLDKDYGPKKGESLVDVTAWRRSLFGRKLPPPSAPRAPQPEGPELFIRHQVTREMPLDPVEDQHRREDRARESEQTREHEVSCRPVRNKR